MVILSIVIALLALLAAFASVWLTRQAVVEAKASRLETFSLRHLDHLQLLAKQVTYLRWSAHAPPYFVNQPLQELEGLLAAEPLDLPLARALGKRVFPENGV